MDGIKANSARDNRASRTALRSSISYNIDPSSINQHKNQSQSAPHDRTRNSLDGTNPLGIQLSQSPLDNAYGDSGNANFSFPSRGLSQSQTDSNRSLSENSHGEVFKLNRDLPGLLSNIDLIIKLSKTESLKEDNKELISKLQSLVENTVLYCEKIIKKHEHYSNEMPPFLPTPNLNPLIGTRSGKSSSENNDQRKSTSEIEREEAIWKIKSLLSDSNNDALALLVDYELSIKKLVESPQSKLGQMEKLSLLAEMIRKSESENKEKIHSQSEIVNFFWLLVGIFTLLSFLVVETIYKGRKNVIVMIEEDDNTSDRNKLRRNKRSSSTKIKSPQKLDDFTSTRTFQLRRGSTKLSG